MGLCWRVNLLSSTGEVVLFDDLPAMLGRKTVEVLARSMQLTENEKAGRYWVHGWAVEQVDPLVQADWMRGKKR